MVWRSKILCAISNKKGIKPLRQFDAKNIAGRAGRFYQHYSGRVIDLNNNFEEIVNGQPEILEHKNYDITFPKTDVDYQITKDKNEVHSYVVDYFFQPEEYEKYDYEYVYAITVLFSQKPVSELAN